MIVFVIGGSGSGKSAYAEKRLLAMEAEKKHYIATMRVFDEEGKKRVEKHRTMRREKGFLTIEKPIDLGEIALDAGDAWMLECVSNLLANEMFTEDGIRDEKETVDKILKDIGSLIEQTADGVIVSNNIFEDGENNDEAMFGLKFEQEFENFAAKRYEANDAFFVKMFTDSGVMKSIVDMLKPIIYRKMRKKK